MSPLKEQLEGAAEKKMIVFYYENRKKPMNIICRKTANTC